MQRKDNFKDPLNDSKSTSVDRDDFIKEFTIYVWGTKAEHLRENNKGHLAIEIKLHEHSQYQSKGQNYISFWPEKNANAPFNIVDNRVLVSKDYDATSYDNDVKLEGREADHKFTFYDLEGIEFKRRLDSEFETRGEIKLKDDCSDDSKSLKNIIVCSSMNPPRKVEERPRGLFHYDPVGDEYADQIKRNAPNDNSCVTQLWLRLSRGNISYLCRRFQNEKGDYPQSLFELIRILESAPKNSPVERQREHDSDVQDNQTCSYSFTLPLYKRVINYCKPSSPLHKLSQAISRLKEDNVKVALCRLYSVLEKEADDEKRRGGGTINTDIVAKHFTDLTKKWVRRPLTVEELSISSGKLQNKLKQQPLSRPLTMAICGVIGAMVGFVLGVTIGAGVTSWGGGFGALPGAILGAVKGFSIGTTLALSGGALIGTTYGFFKSKKTPPTDNLINSADEPFATLATTSKNNKLN